MKRVTLVLILITVISKLLGFFRDIVLSYYYGATNITDAFLISKTIPSFMFMFIGTAIITGYIPMYIKLQKKKNTSKSDEFTSLLINLLLIISTVVVAAIYINTPFFVNLFASGFDAHTLKIAIIFTRINIITIYFMSIIYIFKGYLNINENYIIPELVGIPFNFIVVFFIYLSYCYNKIVLLPIGYSIAVFIQMLFMLIPSFKYGYKYKPVFNFKSTDIKEFLYIIVPTLIGVSVNEINVLVDRTLASRITVGGISIMNYANQLNNFVQGIFVMTVTTVIYPIISKMITKDNIKEFKHLLSRSTISIIILVIPATIGFILFSEQIITLFFGRGAFGYKEIRSTSSVLIFYSIGIIGVAIRELYSRFFYALQDTKTPMVNAAIGLTINIILNIILSKYYGLSGLAFATSISALITSLLLVLSLRKKIGSLGTKQIIISFMKILSASLIMGVIAKLSFNYLTTFLSQILSLLIAIGFGAVSYFVIIYFMKIEDVDIIVGAIKKKLRRRV